MIIYSKSTYKEVFIAVACVFIKINVIKWLKSYSMQLITKNHGINLKSKVKDNTANPDTFEVTFIGYQSLANLVETVYQVD